MNYRINAKLRRKGEGALDQNIIEWKSEDYDSDEELCMAIATELMFMLESDREYIRERGK